MFHKSRIYPLVLVIVLIIVWQYRNSGQEKLITVLGTTMGTTYSVKYLSSNDIDLKLQIDSILEDFNNSLSSYISNSELSQFNKDTVFYFESSYFFPVLGTSREVYDATRGAFDPTVLPLVNAWGFGPDEGSVPDSTTVDSLLNYIGYDKITFDDRAVHKGNTIIALDFSAIAKGYGVDVVGEYLGANGIENFFVEIGGEVVCKGTNNGNKWKIGIEDPTLGMQQREIKAIVELSDRAMATSGNYRNYYVKDGIKYAHTIDPHTGYPVEHTLLSATVFSSTCMVADAYATSFMVLGVEKTREVLDSHKELDAFLIFSKENGQMETWASPGIADLMKINEMP
jgi:thiamine biosynthesis lipoprotein